MFKQSRGCDCRLVILSKVIMWRTLFPSLPQFKPLQCASADGLTSDSSRFIFYFSNLQQCSSQGSQKRAKERRFVFYKRSFNTDPVLKRICADVWNWIPVRISLGSVGLFCFSTCLMAFYCGENVKIFSYFWIVNQIITFDFKVRDKSWGNLSQ